MLGLARPNLAHSAITRSGAGRGTNTALRLTLPMRINHVAVLGVGGVGGYFGGKLCRLQAEGVSVSFVARGEHLREIERSGLVVDTETEGKLLCRPRTLTDDPRKLERPDLCLLCTKEFDLHPAMERLAPLLDAGAVILPLLNGADIHERVRRVVKEGVVFPACVYVGVHVERPGLVVQRGGACKILLGRDPQRPEASGENLVDLFSRAGVQSLWTEQIQVEIWKKFIFICGYGLVAAARDRTLGEIRESEELSAQVRAVMKEVAAVAALAGTPLPADTIEVAIEKASSFPFGARTSFQRDFERADRKDERDLFVGTMLRLGERFGVDVPCIRSIAAGLARTKPWPPGIQSARG